MLSLASCAEAELAGCVHTPSAEACDGNAQLLAVQCDELQMHLVNDTANVNVGLTSATAADGLLRIAVDGVDRTLCHGSFAAAIADICGNFAGNPVPVSAASAADECVMFNPCGGERPVTFNPCCQHHDHNCV